MNRIFEFIPSSEEAVISRILVLVHQAMDQHLPTAGQANRQFTKTVFSDEGERTASLVAALDDEPGPKAASAFGNSEVTSPDGRAAPSDDALPADTAAPSPPAKKPAGADATVADSAFAASGAFTTLGTERQLSGGLATQGPDWITRITLVLLVAGLIMLAYVIFA